MLRLAGPTLAAGLLTLAGSAALAGEAGCATCYRHVVEPAVYGTVAEQVMVRAPRTLTQVVPAEYTTVSEQVLVSPARKVWQVTVDAHGRKVGCWVTVPAQYAVQHRRVLVREEQVIPVAIPAQYGTVHRQVMIQPARSGWQPIGSSPVHKY